MNHRIKYLVAHNRVVLTGGIGLSLIFMARPTFWSIILGIPILVIGEGIRIWSSGHIRKDNELATDGPYLFTRNPLYLGNLFLGIGFSVMSNNWLIIALFLSSFFFIYYCTIEKEEKNLLNRFGDEFIRYKRDVPRFFPRIKRIRINKREFDWSLVKEHREYKTCIGIIGGILFFTIKVIL